MVVVLAIRTKATAAAVHGPVHAKGLRQRFPILQTLYLPSSVLGGALALLAGHQVLGSITSRLWGSGITQLPDNVAHVWRGLPGLLINVVFAALLISM